MKPQHIAVISFTRLGDLIQSVPFLRKLRDRHPQATLTLVVNSAFADGAKRLRGVANVVPLEWDALIPLLDARRGDIAAATAMLQGFTRNIDLTSGDEIYNLAHTKLSATLCGMFDVKRVHGYVRNRQGEFEIHGRWFAYLFSILEERTYNPYNLVEIYSRFVEHVNGNCELGFNVTDAERNDAETLLVSRGIQRGTPLLALQPGASTINRRWPAEKYGELAFRMSERGWKSIVLGSKEERSLAESVVMNSRSTAVSLAGATSVGTLAAVLRCANKLVSNDTGTIHIAAAVGTPCVGIYLGPASAKDTAPYGTGHYIFEADLDCAPCHYRHSCNGMGCAQAVKVQDVVEVILAGEDGPRRIENSRNARVYRTEVLRSGEFRLHRLNNSRTGIQQETLDYYRDFWDAFIGGETKILSQNAQVSASNELSEAYDRVYEIFIIARQTLNRLESARPESHDARIADLLGEQIHWQNLLRAEAQRPSLLTPLVQFVLVLLSTAKMSSLSHYTRDMDEALSHLERGLSLMKPTLAQKDKAHAYA